LLKLKATIEPGWHLYSVTTPPGPLPTRIHLAANPLAKATRALQPKPNRKFDPNFQAESETYDNEAVFLIETEISAGAPAGPLELVARASYQACSDKVCLRQRTKTAGATLQLDRGAAAASIVVPDGYISVPLAAPGVPRTTPASPAAPVNLQTGRTGYVDWPRFLGVAFAFGLAAIFTPCVFPMIPFTMSYFMNRKGASRGDAVMQAAVFCLGIVVLFTAIGLATTAALGPFGVVQLGSNPWVNLFIAALFIVFGLSMLGAFEITLPSGLLTRLNEVSGKGGFGGTLVMGLAFSLTSFACIGPFMGSLLAASVQGDRLMPVAGMATFAAGLAAPFFFLALFPAYLQRLPKSGGWLPRVKVVMGFVILAASVKYLSNVDQVMQWNVLDRGRFLSAWIVLLGFAGLYLVGLLRMEGIEPDSKVGVMRALLGAGFLIFALSLVPGMSCGRLGEIDAYVPACPDGSAETSASVGLKWAKNDYRGVLARAKAEGKLVFVNFTGYACTNCHWMKANMFTRPEVVAAMNDYILVELYTDGTDEASRENQQLQEAKFRTVAIPHYAIIDANENVIASFVGLEKNTRTFVSFLNTPRQARTAGL
jgi:thiol:disulfide interchange protein DsbD